MRWVPEQRDTEELLDLGAGTARERAQSLGDLRRVNRWLGGAAASVREFARYIARADLRSATVLDLGTGSADVPRAIQRWGERHHVRVRVLGVDLKLEHLAVARGLAGTPTPYLVCADAFHLPFADGAVDVVHSALFLHHFRPPALRSLLAEAARVARGAVIMNDLVRHQVPLAFLRATGPVVARSPITRHDGIASILRAYTPEELAAIAGSVPLPTSVVRRHLPYRQCLVVVKSVGG
jgi:SAM-dependent methyltransferase